MLTLLALTLFGCDATLDRHAGPVPATLSARRDYTTTGGRLGNVSDAYVLEVPGYPPLALPACEGAELRSQAEPKVVLWRCAPGPWRPVYLGATRLLGGCALAEGEAPAPLSEALPALFTCHAQPEEVLQEAGEGRAALLIATVSAPLPLDDAGGDAWLTAALALPPAERAEVEAALTTPRSAAGAWRALRLGVSPTSAAAAALIPALVESPRDPLRDHALPALLLSAPKLPDHAALACRAVPGEAEQDLGARDLRAALALALGDAVGGCAALRLPEDACLAALRCDDALCGPAELDARVTVALRRPAWELALQPGITWEDVVAAKGDTPASSRRRTARLTYAQSPASPPCSSAAAEAPCACFDTEVLLTRAVCGDAGPTLRGPGCVAEVNDAKGVILGRRSP